MTASIVARDPETRALGVAVVDAVMNVGALVPAARAGVGVVVCQGAGDASWGALALGLVEGGLSAHDALKALLAVDELRDRRQAIVLDADGGVAVRTGARVVPSTSEAIGDGVAAAATATGEGVADAMVRAYEAADGDLVARLVEALRAARGGEGPMARAARSAALRVIAGDADDVLWDLRVELHDDPVEELARLVDVKRGFRALYAATGRAMTGDPRGALEQLGDLDARFRSTLDFAARKAVLLAMVGRLDEARAICRGLAEDGAGWRLQLARFEEGGLLPEGLVDALFDPLG